MDSLEKSIENVINVTCPYSADEKFENTPKRSAKAWRELTAGYYQTLDDIVGEGLFPADGYDDVITVRDTEFFSTCEHHLLPFWGHVHVAYVPDTTIIGLSKIPRIIELYAKRFQMQERLAQNIMEGLNEILKPNMITVEVDAQHLCVMMRGVQKQGGITTTRASFNRQIGVSSLVINKG